MNGLFRSILVLAIGLLGLTACSQTTGPASETVSVPLPPQPPVSLYHRQMTSWPPRTALSSTI